MTNNPVNRPPTVHDDAALTRMMLKQIITEIGYDVVGEAANGQEAVRMYEVTKPDLVTMDITMPEMDGLQAVKAIQAGAKDFVVKPFQKDRVEQALKRAISS